MYESHALEKLVIFQNRFDVKKFKAKNRRDAFCELPLKVIMWIYFSGLKVLDIWRYFL